MKSTPQHRLAAAIAAFSLALAAAAGGASFHSISSITTSTVNDFYPVENLIQGSGIGIEAAEPHNQILGGAATLWVTDAPGGFPSDYIAVAGEPVLTLDLGADVQLTEISTWGYSTGNANGVKDFTLRFATEADGLAGFGTSITYSPSFSMTIADLPRQSFPFGQAIIARYVEFTAKSSHVTNGGNGGPGGPAGGDRVGLGEIAFEDVVIPDDPAISVPAELALDLTAETAEFVVPVGNSGAAELNITGTNLTGPNSGAFTVTGLPAGAIASLSSANISMEFDPTGLEGPVSATLQIMSNDPSTPTAEVLLSGTVPPANQDISVAGPVIDRSVAAPKIKDVTVSNRGGRTLTLSGASFSGPNAAAFSVVTVPASVAPGSSGLLQIQIDPTGLQGLLSATLLISSDDPDSPTTELPIEAVALGDAAEFFPITGVEVTTAANDLWPVSNLIQGPGTGFDSANPYTKLIDGSGGNWVTNACGFPCDYVTTTGKPVITFDLGADVPLGEISLWGYAATNSNGVSEFSLRFATASDGLGGFGTSVAYNPTFGGINSGEFPNRDNTSRFSFPFAEGAFARYVELTCEDNYFIAPGNGSGGEIPGGDRVGLGEVAFAMLAAPGGDAFAVTSIEYVDGNVTFAFRSRPGREYSVWRSTDLRQSPWEELTDSYPSGGESTTFVDDDVPAGASRVFYQVRPGL